MSNLVVDSPCTLTPPSPEMLDKMNQANDLIRACPQVEIVTEHLIHGGMYARTIRRGPGVVAVGSLILRATILIISGPCTLVTGDRCIDLHGYNVLPGLAGRKQLSLTHGDVEMTMIFPTSAKTVEDAENEIFAEADQLVSRRDGDRGTITITGQ
jgi:hypothetical protein